MSDVISQDPITPQSSWFHRAYNNELDINFHKWWKRGAMVSMVLVLIFGASLLVRGLNLGIEFEGGLVWEVEADLGAGEVRDAMADIGFGDAIIQTGDGTVQVRAEVAADHATVGAEVARALAELAGTSADNVSFNDISASWGDDVTNKAETALVVFLIAISFYLSFRTEWRMAVGALAALVHDILITVGVYSLFQFEVTSATVIAFLTILGYSLYDTLVVFDRVQENEVRPSLAGKVGYDDIMNLSLNQVVMRSINTTITSVLPVLMVLLVGSFGFGAVTLKEFAIALVIGMLAGTYSSMFVAGPIVNWLKRREPRYAELVGKTERVSRRDLAAMASSTTTRPRQKRDENKVKRLDTKTSLGSAQQAAIPARPRKQKRRN